MDGGLQPAAGQIPKRGGWCDCRNERSDLVGTADLDLTAVWHHEGGKCGHGHQGCVHELGSTSESALFLTAGMPTRAGHLAATGHTLANGVQNAPNELSRAQTPLRHTQFEYELVGYPDKAWVSMNRTHWPSIFHTHTQPVFGIPAP